MPDPQDKPGDRIIKTFAENSAHLRNIMDKYLGIMAGAEKHIQREKAQDNPSQWKIESMVHIRDRAEENLARMKMGPDRLPDWLMKARGGK